MAVEDMTPAEMLDAAMEGKLSLDGDALPVAAQEEQAKTDDEQADEGQQDKQDSDEPEGAPIASKSGAYAIPYEKLAQAREKAHTLESENEALKAQLSELTAKQQAPAVLHQHDRNRIDAREVLSLAGAAGARALREKSASSAGQTSASSYQRQSERHTQRVTHLRRSAQRVAAAATATGAARCPARPAPAPRPARTGRAPRPRRPIRPRPSP